MAQPISLSALVAGTVVGNTELVDPIGFGGSAIVYKGRLNGRRTVAVKECFPINAKRGHDSSVLWPAGLRDTALDDMRREAVILDRLDGSGAPELIKTFTENETRYIVMDYIEGEQLTIWGEKTRQLSGFSLALNQLAAALLTVLAKLHSMDITHGDVAPPNILVRENLPILIDFGAGGAPGFQEAAARHDRKDYRPVTNVNDYDPASFDTFGLCAALYDAWLGRALSTQFGTNGRQAATELLQNSELIGGDGAATLARMIDLGLAEPTSADMLLQVIRAG